MSIYWEKFWNDFTTEISSEKPFHQVARTLDKKQPSKEEFSQLIRYTISKLDLKPNHLLLDFCCGNGLFAQHISQHCKQVCALDFCRKLIKTINELGQDNIIGIHCDALQAQFPDNSFDRIFFSAALQHFAESEVVQLFGHFKKWLKPGGLIMITDILDKNNIWDFYNNHERRTAYFQNLERQTPILGTWFNRNWLEQLGKHYGFKQPSAISQPKEFWYSHYRFDYICYKE